MSSTCRVASIAVVAASVVGCSLVVKDPIEVLGRGHDPGAPTFSRVDAIAELDALAGLIDRVHPDPYRFHPRAIVDAERRRLSETMPASLTRIELCLRLNRLIATMDDGHTRPPQTSEPDSIRCLNER